ncbi:MAG: hypothetical protein II008_16080, partial [Oscillospiraceae bacterium]|nr:hypothetical protein [Oscillospiraceae bacterium]
MKKSIDLQVFIKYNEEKSAPKKSVPFRGKGKTLALSSVLRPRKVFWEDFTQIITRGGTNFVRAEMYASAQQQKSEVGRSPGAGPVRAK